MQNIGNRIEDTRGKGKQQMMIETKWKIHDCQSGTRLFVVLANELMSVLEINDSVSGDVLLGIR